MVFWRKKKNIKEQEELDKEQTLLHREDDPEIPPPTEYDPELDKDFVDHELAETDNEVLDELRLTPVPEHTPLSDVLDDEQEQERDKDAETGGWLSRLTKGLTKSSTKITKGIGDLVTKRKLDSEVLNELEDLLIASDLGPHTAARLVEELSRNRFGKEISNEEICQFLAESIEKILYPVAKEIPLENAEDGPAVILVCGVNGVGKTTTIGKLAWLLKNKRGKKVMMAAGDTFRAAALEQLAIWAKKTGSELIAKDIGADSAAVAYESYEQAKKQGVDVLLIDTAGRLHNKSNLMDELGKIIRVLKKQNDNIPHEILLVLDATTGQNAHAQLETFKEVANISGLIVTKLDGSAKGGVVVSLADQFGLPIYAVGIGETEKDLQPFRAGQFARSLVGLPQ